MTTDGDEVMVRVEPRQRLYALMKRQPEVFFSYGGFTERFGCLGIRLAKAETKLLTELLTSAWRRIASKKALSAFDDAS